MKTRSLLTPNRAAAIVIATLLAVFSIAIEVFVGYLVYRGTGHNLYLGIAAFLVYSAIRERKQN